MHGSKKAGRRKTRILTMDRSMDEMMEIKKPKESVISYDLVRSARRSIAIQISCDGHVTVRAPRRCDGAAIERFLREKQEWILRKQKELQEKTSMVQDELEKQPKLTKEDYRRYQELAVETLARKAALYADRMQVTYGNITIRDQKTRWGSCSARGNLNFNWRLILAPEEVLDYVVIHELAHRREMNHSERFWREVEQYCPDYRDRKKWLREHGTMLMQM